jgi:hypothetical protein
VACSARVRLLPCHSVRLGCGQRCAHTSTSFSAFYITRTVLVCPRPKRSRGAQARNASTPCHPIIGCVSRTTCPLRQQPSEDLVGLVGKAPDKKQVFVTRTSCRPRFATEAPARLHQFLHQRLRTTMDILGPKPRGGARPWTTSGWWRGGACDYGTEGRKVFVTGLLVLGSMRAPGADIDIDALVVGPGSAHRTVGRTGSSTPGDPRLSVAPGRCREASEPVG